VSSSENASKGLGIAAPIVGALGLIAVEQRRSARAEILLLDQRTNEIDLGAAQWQPYCVFAAGLRLGLGGCLQKRPDGSISQQLGKLILA
jgi:hypothetical protein